MRDNDTITTPKKSFAYIHVSGHNGTTREFNRRTIFFGIVIVCNVTKSLVNNCRQSDTKFVFAIETSQTIKIQLQRKVKMQSEILK